MAKVLRCWIVVYIALSDASTPAATPPETVEYTAAPAHARFRVPATWQHRDVTGIAADIGFLFDPAPASNKPKRPTFQQLIEIYLAPAPPGDATLAAVADTARAGLLRQTPGIKFFKDAPAPFAGRSVWLLQWTEKITLTGPPGPDGTPQKMGFIEIDRSEYVWTEHDAVVHVGLHADARFMPSLTQKATAVAKTIVFDTPPATTQP